DAVALNHSAAGGLGIHCLCRSVKNVTVGSHVIAAFVRARWTHCLRRQEVDGQHHKKKGQQNLDLAKGISHLFETSLLGILLTSVGKNEQKKPAYSNGRQIKFLIEDM